MSPFATVSFLGWKYLVLGVFELVLLMVGIYELCM